jgi:hypothetical protein
MRLWLLGGRVAGSIILQDVDPWLLLVRPHRSLWRWMVGQHLDRPHRRLVELLHAILDKHEVFKEAKWYTDQEVDAYLASQGQSGGNERNGGKRKTSLVRT